MLKLNRCFLSINVEDAIQNLPTSVNGAADDNGCTSRPEKSRDRPLKKIWKRLGKLTKDSPDKSPLEAALERLYEAHRTLSSEIDTLKVRQISVSCNLSRLLVL